MNIVDVGASVGVFSEYVARDADNQVLAVEPLADIAAQIPKRRNISVSVTAVRDVPKKTALPFNRAAFSELSSFMPPNHSLDKVLWANHLAAADSVGEVCVEAVSLEYLLEQYAFRETHFLKVDAQGVDLEVLQSAGAMRETIHSAVLEFPYDEKSALYDNEPSLLEALSLAKEWGFLPARIVPNGGGECNVFFYNQARGLDNYLRIEQRLNLFSAPCMKLDLRYGKKIRPPVTEQAMQKLRELVSSFRR